MELNSASNQTIQKTILIKDTSSSSSSSSDEDDLDLSKTYKRTNADKSRNEKSKKKRISTKSRLESIEENELSVVDSSESLKSSSSFIRCFQNFGVKSYLDDFYENKRNKKNSDSDDALYCQEKKKSTLLRTSWKIVFWFGILLLVWGLIATITGFVVQRKHTVELMENVKIIDENAVDYNYKLDMCKMFGLIVFAFGGFLSACSLILPAFFCSKKCLIDDEAFKEPIETKHSVRSILKNFKGKDSKKVEMYPPISQD